MPMLDVIWEFVVLLSSGEWFSLQWTSIPMQKYDNIHVSHSSSSSRDGMVKVVKLLELFCLFVILSCTHSGKNSLSYQLL